jgi:RNA polymerase sigma-70 factor (ECF subfamily)
MSEPSGTARRDGVFVTTQWTQVLAARGQSESARDALQVLCGAYYGPVIEFLRRTGLEAEPAREIAHEFFAELIGSDGLRGLQRGHGRFRSYLLGALKHFVANRKAYELREKRGGGIEHLAMDGTNDTDHAAMVPSVRGPLDAWFDREWALTLVEHVLERLEMESKSEGKADLFDALKPWLTLGQSSVSPQETAQRLELSEGALKVAVHRARKRFRELVREEIARTLHAPEDIEAEMRHLVEALTLES